MSRFDVSGIKALVFDVFGTVVDWRAGVIREGEALAAAEGLSVDWPAFADAWRAGYQPAMRRALSGEIAWMNVDGLHRAILDELIPRFGLEALSEIERERFNRVWHRLDPWPDAVAGLTRLKARFVVSTLSNGNIALLVDMAKRAGLPWDCVLSAELMVTPGPTGTSSAPRGGLSEVAKPHSLMTTPGPTGTSSAPRGGTSEVAKPHSLMTTPGPTGTSSAPRGGMSEVAAPASLMRHYKPDPEVYQGAAALLGVARHELLMVAAHPSDLRGAARAGLRTALVHRPLERGPNPTGAPPPDALPDDRFEIVADDFVDLARRLGA